MLLHLSSVKRLDPVVTPEGDILLRFLVIKVGSVRATYSARAVQISGTTTAGPEKPYDASWRGYDDHLPVGHRSIAAGDEEMVDVARGPLINEGGARKRSPKQWSSLLQVSVGSRAGPERHPVPLPGIRDVDDFLNRELELTFLIRHEESGVAVARVRVRIWYRRNESGGLQPDLEIVS